MFCKNVVHELDYKLNANVGQGTRAIPGILNSKNVIWIFLLNP